MKKFFLVIFILFDLAIILASAAFLITRLKGNPSPLSKSPLSTFYPSKSSATAAASHPVTADTTTAAAPAVVATSPGAAATRKIGFTYRNSRAKKVQIRGDFTGWKGEPMQKDPVSGYWKYMAVLEPGEYGYLYSVDDRPKLDPANKRTKKIGNTLVSSINVRSTALASH